MNSLLYRCLVSLSPQSFFIGNDFKQLLRISQLMQKYLTNMHSPQRIFVYSLFHILLLIVAIFPGRKMKVD